ncbi:hypothetical protein SK128_026202, partial [Halocaridina rubra]
MVETVRIYLTKYMISKVNSKENNLCKFSNIASKIQYLRSPTKEAYLSTTYGDTIYDDHFANLYDDLNVSSERDDSVDRLSFTNLEDGAEYDQTFKEGDMNSLRKSGNGSIIVKTVVKTNVDGQQTEEESYYAEMMKMNKISSNNSVEQEPTTAIAYTAYFKPEFTFHHALKL